MKTLKLLFAIIITGTLLSSCTTINNDGFVDNYQPTLEEVVSEYDLWYVDYHRTTGSGDIPYVSRAFTLSFINGVLSFGKINFSPTLRFKAFLGLSFVNSSIETPYFLDIPYKVSPFSIT